MSARGSKDIHLSNDIDFIKTPAAKPSGFETGEDCGIALTKVGPLLFSCYQPVQILLITQKSPTIHNGPLPADGAGNESFSNALLAGAIIGVPSMPTFLLGGGVKTFVFFTLILALPLLVVFWTWSSACSPPTNNKAKLPGRPIEHYVTFVREEDRSKWHGKNKIPIQSFAEMYLDGLVDFNGDTLDVMEYRHDWANFTFTWPLFKFIIFTFFMNIIFHSKAQDDEQVRPNYDRGNDHYAWFLGPRMIYTSGIISDPDREETLEEMQDNKMAVVCEKIGLKEDETMLDIGCGWGTLAKFASLNYGARVTGLTIAENQAAWGNDTLRKAGIPEQQSRVLCMDYRDIPHAQYDKITQLEMGEHVGIRKLTGFFRQCYNLLKDNGVMYVQLSGLRQAWQYEDFIWGLYLNKYIFRGADASTPLWYYVKCLEQAGFEVKGCVMTGYNLPD